MEFPAIGILTIAIDIALTAHAAHADIVRIAVLRCASLYLLMVYKNVVPMHGRDELVGLMERMAESIDFEWVACTVARTPSHMKTIRPVLNGVLLWHILHKTDRLRRDPPSPDSAVECACARCATIARPVIFVPSIWAAWDRMRPMCGACARGMETGAIMGGSAQQCACCGGFSDTALREQHGVYACEKCI